MFVIPSAARDLKFDRIAEELQIPRMLSPRKRGCERLGMTIE